MSGERTAGRSGGRAAARAASERAAGRATAGERGGVAEHPRRDSRSSRRSGSLLKAELRRWRGRRFIRLLLALALLGYLVVVPLIAYTQFARTTPAELTEARSAVDRIVAEQAAFREQCLANPPSDAPEGMTPEEVCGPAMTAADVNAADFLPRRPFVFTEALQVGTIAVGVAVAALFFVIGATWVGAEWSARTMTALLFWETRRLRVLAVKVVVLAAAAALTAAFAQALWAGSAWLIASTRGTTSGRPARFWTDAAQNSGRAVLLAVLVALIGFGVAHLTRGTGAALGVGFVYFAVAETAVNVVRPVWQEWLVTRNVAALLLPDGITIFRPGRQVDDAGQVVEGVEVVIGNLHGAALIGGLAVVLLLVGAVLFLRRDLT
jgi:ABC-2 type transport system permease protein